MNNIADIQFHVVDDNDIDIAVNTKLLQLSQMSAHIFSYNGAIAFLDEIARRPEYFASGRHIVLLDIMMPRMNGFDCLDALRDMDESIRSHINVFMLTSSIDRNDIRRAEAYPMVQKVLEKPLDIYLLKKSIENLD